MYRCLDYFLQPLMSKRSAEKYTVDLEIFSLLLFREIREQVFV